ncbi:M20 family metallopeptidase [Desulfitibacter alkalitolerans]|uniref:M20 family metallopeptidase n=1 Tax=Desulfitibacter alkalitolerans TaxID=264641 RepID=UPI000A075EA7|nr:M20 family metallopeptidase [Desulfitibacter alkalitolerans]
MQEKLKAITSYLNNKSEELEFLLSTLVNIDSGSYDYGGVSRVIQTLAVNLKELGYQVFIKKTSDAPNLVAKKYGTGDKKILLVGHADTVFERGTALSRPYKIEGDKILGPGIADMKAGLVTMVYALKALESIQFTSYKEITVIVGGDEEIGSPSSKQIYENEAADADACFVFEPGRADGSLVSARKGVGSFNLTLLGIPAHAGESPEKGASAIRELAHKILALEELNKLYNGVTLTVGVISGGTRANIIPEKATAEIDVRLPDLQTAHEVIDRIKEISEKTADSRIQAILEGELNRPPMIKTEGTKHLLNIVKDMGSILGMEITDTATGGASDGNFVAALGVPVLDGMGPAGGNYHRDDEFVYRKSLLQKTKLTALTLCKLGMA